MTCGTTDPNTMWNFNTNYKVEDIGHLVSVGEEIQDSLIQCGVKGIRFNAQPCYFVDLR